MRAGDSQKSTGLPSSCVLVSVLSECKAKWRYLATHAEQVPNYYKHVLSIFRKFKALTPNFMGRQLITIKFIFQPVRINVNAT